MPWGAAIGAVAAVGSAALSSSASGSESDDTAAATKKALNMQQSNLTNTSGLEGNTIAVGQNALATTADLSGAMGAQNQQAAANLFQTDPGYQFDLTQGLKAVDNSSAARGLGTSGANIKGSAQYAEGLADQSYGNFYNRLSNIATGGQQAIQTVANAGANAATNNSQTVTSGATQQNQITTNGTNALTGTVNNLANNGAVLNALSSYGSTTTPDQFTALGGTGGF